MNTVFCSLSLLDSSDKLTLMCVEIVNLLTSEIPSESWCNSSKNKSVWSSSEDTSTPNIGKSGFRHGDY